MLFGYRLRLFSLAQEIGVRPACRAMGVHHSTYYRWKRRVDRWGLEALQVRERRRPRMPNELGAHLEQRIIAFALAHPGFGPKRIAAELARERWGGIAISQNGVWRCLRRHGLNTRANGWVWSPAMPLDTNHDPTRTGRKGMLRPTTPVSLPVSTVSTSAVSPAQKERSGNTPRSTSPRATPGPSSTPHHATPEQSTAQRSSDASLLSSLTPAGASRTSSQTTEANSAPALSLTRSTHSM